MDIFVTGAFALLGIVLGGSVTHHTQWGIDKRRLKRQRKQQIIDNLRSFITQTKYSDSELGEAKIT